MYFYKLHLLVLLMINQSILLQNTNTSKLVTYNSTYVATKHFSIIALMVKSVGVTENCKKFHIMVNNSHKHTPNFVKFRGHKVQ